MADRFDEVIAELRSDPQEMRREFKAWSAHIDRMSADGREHPLLCELNRRGELALQELVRSQSAMREEIRATVEEIRANTETILANTETTKGQSRAIYALVDRLEGGSGGLSPAT